MVADKQIKVSTRIGLGYGIALVLCFAGFIFAASTMRSLARNVDVVASDRLAKVAQLQQMRNNFNAQGHQVRNILISDDRAFQDAELKKIVNIKSLNGDIVTKLRATEQDADAIALLKSVAEFSQPFYQAIDRTVALAYEGKAPEAREQLIGEMRNRQMPLFKAVDDSLILQMDSSRQLATAAIADAGAAAWGMLLIGLVVAVAAVVVCLWTARWITRALGSEPAALGAAVRRFADGDLSAAPGAGAAVPGSVLAAIGTMQANWARIVGQVRASSDSIATGSAQIAMGNADLNQRTEEQAGSLQQTASSMEQVGATVRHSADTAGEASRLAADAAAAAARGSELVGHAVLSMQGIADSSKKIGDIIGVIDGIAFQTNILALNAAVEAARAGEQGRGFAVVASEVRSLAGRSADAAKEIKSLIQASVLKVEDGLREVNDAGASMAGIVSQAQGVDRMITEISTAAVQQSRGIVQIGEAVDQLDRMTQQNAALVEESAAAADSLRRQAASLASVVSAFKLDTGAGTAGYEDGVGGVVLLPAA
ncbi:methyl-accepting chemotaxis protein [Xylophilus ampelinus]|uniref:Methyl-accepting chemotaxis protein n=1 Tax=Xylophilus ampelinus TaxID=54067 RepID=A0A318SK43_9BURK|nr:methyl-accepting chemotaxis protein [Xylophilus ampelinus]MCS4510643.1 methyl-accepting chemotaxis protein [Xylophilus ampelinus]PYE76334.1 methyl-accepting chemotaxis protein [Xylophilus ampelinus]